MKILLGCTGSVATIKVHEIAGQLMALGFEVQVVATNCAKHFVNNNLVNVRVWTDEDEWAMWKERGDPVLHVELRKWADVLLIAPLDANTMAKLAQGICDNLLTCVARAWDLKKPLVFCPAMNTHMYEHPLTAEHIGKLKSFGYYEIPCVIKTLMCGDTGAGAMADIQTIVKHIKQLNSQ